MTIPSSSSSMMTVQSSSTSTTNLLSPSSMTPEAFSVPAYQADYSKYMSDSEIEDEEESVNCDPEIARSTKKQRTLPPEILQHKRSVDVAQTEIVSQYRGREIKFGGNQMIRWSRDMIQLILQDINGERQTKINLSLSKQATIQSPKDWLLHTGIFCGFNRTLSLQAPIFTNGILTVQIRKARDETPAEVTTIQFKLQGTSRVLHYAILTDPIVIDYLATRGMKEIKSNPGMSYPDLVDAITIFKRENNRDDDYIASRQLDVLNILDTGQQVTELERFLAYFNAILFGSEASRNYTSYLTGTIVLECIRQKRFTYEQGFRTPSKAELDEGKQVTYAIYPMASPHAGEGNFRGYADAMKNTKEEERSNNLSSQSGLSWELGDIRSYQITVKEALLLKYWARAQDLDKQVPWKKAGESNVPDAVDFARAFSQSVHNKISDTFGLTRKYVLTPDEYNDLKVEHDTSTPSGLEIPSGLNQEVDPSAGVAWKEPNNPQSTVTNFQALKFHVVDKYPLALIDLTEEI